MEQISAQLRERIVRDEKRRIKEGMVKRIEKKEKKVKVKRRPSTGPFLTYCLYHTHCDKTYTGVTNCFQRRIRQHRAEIAGGARYTRGMHGKEGTWHPIFHVIGFQTKRAVLQFEIAAKKRKVPVSFDPGAGRKGGVKKAYTRGPSGRVRQLEYLLSLGRLNDEQHSPFRENGISVQVHISFSRYLALAGMSEDQFNAARQRQGIRFQFL